MFYYADKEHQTLIIIIAVLVVILITALVLYLLISRSHKIKLLKEQNKVLKNELKLLKQNTNTRLCKIEEELKVLKKG